MINTNTPSIQIKIDPDQGQNQMTTQNKKAILNILINSDQN